MIVVPKLKHIFISSFLGISVSGLLISCLLFAVVFCYLCLKHIFMFLKQNLLHASTFFYIIFCSCWPFVFNTFCSCMISLWTVPADSGDTWDFTFSLHHLAWLRSPRVSRFLPQLPVQSARVGLFEFGPWTSGGALQRWDRTLRDLLSRGHLPPAGSCAHNQPTLGGGTRRQICLI